MIQTVRRLERKVTRLEKEIKRLTADKAFLLKEVKALRRKIKEGLPLERATRRENGM